MITSETASRSLTVTLHLLIRVVGVLNTRDPYHLIPLRVEMSARPLNLGAAASMPTVGRIFIEPDQYLRLTQG